MGPPPRDDARGTDDSFIRSLYDQYAAALLSVVMRQNGGDRQWAEDVVQESFLRAWQHTDGLVSERGSRSLMPWLVTVARRIVINDWHRRQARPREIDQSMLFLVAIPDETERLLTRSVIEDALGELTPNHRRVVIEMCLRGRTVDDVAEIMGVPSGTVKSRMHYALRAMRVALENNGVTAPS